MQENEKYTPPIGAGKNPHSGLEDAVSRLASPCYGDLGVRDVIALGVTAVPAVRALVIEREPSGLYEARRRAVEVLQRLGATDALIDCLRILSSREAADPVEQTGDDAVMNAVARALSDCERQRVRSLLLELGKRRHLAGVIEALGALHCREALPTFVEALADDFARPAAEYAIRNIGDAARPSLCETIRRREPIGEREYTSRTRQRLSALTLLEELADPKELRSALTALMDDATPAVAALAREIASRLME